MMHYALIFLLVAVVFAFANLESTAGWIVKVLLVISLVMFIASLVKHTRRRGKTPAE
jgi:uncharacterized membrane protein YtjA (UPF0391 family)